MTNCESEAMFLPCTSVSLPIWLNCVKLKSAARLACLPSMPTTPIPTLAAWIMLRSFPPSPLAAALFSTSLTTTAFCSGARQQTTVGAAARSSRRI